MLPSRNGSYCCCHQGIVLFRDKQAGCVSWLEVVSFFNKFRFRSVCALSLSLRDVLTWPGSSVVSLIDSVCVNTARTPCPLGLFCPQSVFAALHDWPFLSKSEWTGSLCTFLAGWSSGCDVFSLNSNFVGCRPGWNNSWLATWWTMASQPVSELLLLSAFIHLCTFEVQGSVSLLLLSLSLGLCLDLSWAFSTFPAVTILKKFSGKISSCSSTLGHPLCNPTSTGALRSVSNNCDPDTCPNLTVT